MLIAEKDASTVPPRILLKGVIDETTNFKTLFTDFSDPLNLHCKDVVRINSLGIKIAKEFFTSYRASGRLLFFEISPPLVATVNTVVDFIKKTEIVSVCAPFMCDDCGKTSLKTVQMTELADFVKSDLKMPCPFCKKTAEFDDIPNLYFSFLLK